MEKQPLPFDALVGFELDFFGVDGSSFCVRRLGVQYREAFEAVEDPDDGLRSMLREVAAVPLAGRRFFRQPIARVVVERDDELEGWRLRSPVTGHVWLRLGTDRSYDDLYPTFTFTYEPDRTQRLEPDGEQ